MDTVTARVWLTIPQRHVCRRIDLAAVELNFGLACATREPRAILLVGRYFRVERAKQAIAVQLDDLIYTRR